MRHELEGMRLHKAVQHIQIDKRKVRRYITYVLDSPHKEVIVYDSDEKQATKKTVDHCKIIDATNPTL